MVRERLFDHSYKKGILNPTHGKGHLFSDDLIQNFFRLIINFEYERNTFKVHDTEWRWNPPVFVCLEKGTFTPYRSSTAYMQYEYNEFVYAIPILKDSTLEENIPLDGYHFDNVLIIGTNGPCENSSTEFVEMMEAVFKSSGIEVISTMGKNQYEDPYEELIVRDKNNDYWCVRIS